MRTVLVYGLTNMIGGIENYLILMQKYLQNEIEFVFLVEEVNSFIYKDIIEQNNGKIEFLPNRHKFQEYRIQFHNVLRQYKSLTNTLYVNVSHISFDIIPIRMGLCEGYNLITHSHGAGQEPIKSLRYRIRHDILRFIGNLCLKYSNVERLAVSKRAGDFLYKGRSYKIVSPGIEVDRFRFNEQVRSEIRTKYKLDNFIVLGFVGRLVAVKNPLFLIDVLYITKQYIPNIKLLIVGDGDLKNEMEYRAKIYDVTENIIFTGAVNNVQDFLQAMDVFLAPSLSEGMPLGIMEAQSAGVPCVCAKGNFPETIDVTGLIHYCELSAGGTGWSNEIRKVLSKKLHRTDLNELVRGSILNIENASKRLLEVFN